MVSKIKFSLVVLSQRTIEKKKWWKTSCTCDFLETLIEIKFVSFD